MRTIPLRRTTRAARFTGDLRLHGMVLRMITLNSLSAFAQEISRRPGTDTARGITAVAAAGRSSAATAESATGQRTLETAPSGPAPSGSMPRGSLLDLRV